MQVSIKWLKDYIDFDWSAEELADRFTMAGVPVENVIRADEGLDKVVTGRIEKLEKHPDSDHLQICQMNVGEKDLIQIITGAQNVAEGQVVPVAMVGAHLPNGLHIKKGKLRGLPSNGMLCSAGELHLDLTKLTEEEKDGIYILPADTPVVCRRKRCWVSMMWCLNSSLRRTAGIASAYLVSCVKSLC